MWFSVLIWSAYLMADWVATYALGHLSKAQVNHDNNDNGLLRAIWAPLLLLHLGGPDTITAYSLEDNQLWLRHLLGLGVQLFMAVYVIMMSWKYSWFSFMSFPAWWLESSKWFPFGPVSRCYRDIQLFWNALEVEMGLMYDLLYTKAVINYSKAGWILRSISFTCTVIVSLGLSVRLIFMREDHQEKWDVVDIAITGVLLGGALALEIYAVIVLYFSFDWTMLWIVKENKSRWATQLRQRFPCLFREKKYRSKMMAQFDLLGFCIKEKSDHQKPIRRMLGSVLGNEYQDKLNGYLHKTVVHVHPLLYREMLDYCGNLGVVSDRIESMKRIAFAGDLPKSLFKSKLLLRTSRQKCATI
ncbi:hypothetical protein C3L33_12537, partial [Rhododendron williamsianum]